MQLEGCLVFIVVVEYEGKFRTENRRFAQFFQT